MPRTSWPTRSLFGIPIHALRMDEALAVVKDTIERREKLLIGVVNAAKMVNMHRDAELRESVLTADLVLADGQAVVWACRLLGRPLPERVAGIDLMNRMIDQAAECGHRVFCLGATTDVLDAAIDHFKARCPKVIIAGRQHGYFKPDEEEALARAIRESQSDILFVAMTSPKKERFLARWFNEMNVAVCHGVGGSFDVVAGKVKRAPAFWQRCGMEWLYRVLQEPRRMWKRYLVTNTLFCWMLLGELTGRWKKAGTQTQA